MGVIRLSRSLKKSLQVNLDVMIMMEVTGKGYQEALA